MSLKCDICFHHCELDEGRTGLCRARANRGGQIVPLNYGRLTSLALDPIEKKPLRRFHPGGLVLSLGSFGCNLRCPFCQNAEISMAGAEFPARDYSPEALVQLALALRPRGNLGLAYTYNEPLVGYEFVRDCAALVREAGMFNVLVTNGTIEEAPWRALLPLIDAVNIDLKGFSQAFYEVAGGDFEAVRRTIATLAAAPACHLEVTTLVIPGLNDDGATIDAAAAWLASLDPAIPYHLTRFFPCHRMADRPPTPVADLHRLAAVARRHLGDVQLGNC